MKEGTVTKSQYMEAQRIVEQYQKQEYEKSLLPDKVKLSDWGIEMQGKHHKDRKGIVLSKYLAGAHDYNVIALWEDGKKGSMHESQVKIIK